MRRVLVSICVALLSTAPAAARMYQWQNAATGTTQLSGTPPAWYRSSARGPRVYVFENNQLVDDTGIVVSAEQRDALRAQAFGQPPAAGLAREDAPARAAPGEDKPTLTKPVSALPAAAVDSVVIAPTASVESTTVGKAAALKALIDAWDQHQLDQARSLLDMLPSENKPVPTPR